VGQQQLYLLVLAIILVGIAVAVGMNRFSTSAAEANRDQLILDLNFLSVAAQSYYKKPASYGGGGQSFTGWELPEYFKDYEIGKIRIKIKKRRNEVTIKATGTEIGRDGKKVVNIEAKVKATSFKIKIKN